MLLKKDYDFGDEEYSSCGGESDSGNDEVLDPNSKAYQKLPTAVKKQLQSLSGQVESLHDENKKLKEVGHCVLNMGYCQLLGCAVPPGNLMSAV